MLIDIRKLNVQKKYVGEMEFSYQAPDDLVSIPYVKFSSPVIVRFSYELFADDALEIHGTVSYHLEGQCSRCLKSAQTEVVGEINALFEPTKDCEDYSYSNGVVDLKQAVDEAVAMSMPFTLSCGDDCESIGYVSDSASEKK